MSSLASARRCLAAVLMLLAPPAMAQTAEPIEVKVFVGAMFEIGELSGDRAGEFQYWYDRYWKDSAPIAGAGALNPVFCDADGVCGSVLGMGKVSSSASMQAILLNPRFDFSRAYFILSGVAGTPPSRGTIGAVNWATWLVDYDLGHRWAQDEVPAGEPLFMPRKGYESIRVYELNPALVAWAVHLSEGVALADSPDAKAYRHALSRTRRRGARPSSAPAPTSPATPSSTGRASRRRPSTWPSSTARTTTSSPRWKRPASPRSSVASSAPTAC